MSRRSWQKNRPESVSERDLSVLMEPVLCVLYCFGTSLPKKKRASTLVIRS